MKNTCYLKTSIFTSNTHSQTLKSRSCAPNDPATFSTCNSLSFAWLRTNASHLVTGAEMAPWLFNIVGSTVETEPWELPMICEHGQKPKSRQSMVPYCCPCWKVFNELGPSPFFSLQKAGLSSGKTCRFCDGRNRLLPCKYGTHKEVSQKEQGC